MTEQPIGQEPMVSIRHLQDAGTPLRKFYGVLDSYPHEDTGFERTRVNLNFASIEVLQAEAPYNLPTATISINLSNKKNSSWGIFSESLNELIPEDEDLPFCVGKRIGMVMGDGQEGRPERHKFGVNRETQEDIIASCWQVFEVAGAVKGAKQMSAKDKLIDMLDGKTMQEHSTLALADPLVRQSEELQTAIMNKSFYTGLEQAGMFTKDAQGVYHKA